MAHGIRGNQPDERPDPEKSKITSQFEEGTGGGRAWFPRPPDGLTAEELTEWAERYGRTRMLFGSGH